VSGGAANQRLSRTVFRWTSIAATEGSEKRRRLRRFEALAVAVRGCAV
jgi:hypothetical protein